MRIACSGLLILLALPWGMASAQQQQQSPQQQVDSIAEAARRSRDQKKEQPKSAKVWDNDTLPTKPGGVNVIGQSAPTTDASGNPPAANTQVAGSAAEAGASKSASKSASDVKALQVSLASAKDQLQALKTELDILQRKYNLDSQMYYSKPNYAADTEGAAKLADEKSQIDLKQQEVDAAQKKVSQLEEELKNSGAGGDSSGGKTN
jgi:hypothetical protein